MQLLPFFEQAVIGILCSIAAHDDILHLASLKYVKKWRIHKHAAGIRKFCHCQNLISGLVYVHCDSYASDTAYRAEGNHPFIGILSYDGHVLPGQFLRQQRTSHCPHVCYEFLELHAVRLSF